jgi:septum formation protein
MDGPRIILASASPRRRELLTKIVDDFEVIPSRIAEKIPSGISPLDVAMNNALEKALDISTSYPDSIVIGMDTVVVLEGVIMGKPTDTQDAITMLRALSGRTHQVITGVAMVNRAFNIQFADFESSEVTFKQLDLRTIEDYVNDKRPFDMAGGYGIQDVKDSFIENLDGDLYNVMGLPVELVVDMLDMIIMGTMG